MKYNYIIWAIFTLIVLAYGWYSAYAIINRVPSLEEMQADRDQKNKEVRERCEIDSSIYATGSTERQKSLSSQKWESQCLQEYLLEDLNTNLWTYTGDIAPVPERINSNISNSINSTYEQSIWSVHIASSATSSNWGEVLEARETQRVWMDSAVENRQQILTGSHVTQDGGHGTKGTEKEIRSPERILTILWLDHCRIVQHEGSHITQKRGHVYATDVACERGKSFTVSAPEWKKSYTVKAVWVDKRIGNYIVLEQGSYMFVFWHTESPHKVWERILAGTQIWFTDKSWIAENVHLHFELWRDGYNITHDEMLGAWSEWNDQYSLKILLQRNWYTSIDDALDFISQPGMEWFSATSYEDPKWSGRWSIGFWTYANGPWETITREEAKKRAYTKVLQNMEFIYKNRLAYSWNERIALSSFFYNLGTNRPEMIEALKKRNMWELEVLWKRYINPGSIYENWLLKRRIKEWIKFITP